MKKMSKFFSLAVAAVMTLCLCSFGVIFEASADTVSTLTINKPTGSSLSFVGHTYTAYKVFAATKNATGDAYTYTLDANCLGGTTGYGTEYQPSNDSINTAAKAREFGEFLKTNYIDGKTPSAYNVSVGPITSDSNSISISVEQAGYYLIVDTYAGAESVVSLVMLDTLASTEEQIVVKADPASTLTKQVKNDDTSAWGTVTDTEIGENAEYKLAAKVPRLAVEEYSNYTFKIEDVLDAGLTYNGDVTVYTTEDKTEGSLVAASNYTVTAPTSENGNKLTIDFSSHIKDLAAANSGALKGNNLYVFYTAKLNGNAKYATQAVDTTNFNKNTAKLIYSKSPYDTAVLETSANLTYDWTFGFQFQKVNRKGLAALSGAKFKVTKAGADMKFTEKSSGKYYVDPDSSNTQLICASDGTLELYGFDDGTEYTLVETEAPSGFSVGGETTFVINSTTYSDSGDTLQTMAYAITGKNIAESGAAVAADANYSPANANTDGSVTITAMPAKIWNSSGTELIGTGGIGTTIFYIAGGILMAGAAILLLTKLRMKNKD